MSCATGYIHTTTIMQTHTLHTLTAQKPGLHLRTPPLSSPHLQGSPQEAAPLPSLRLTSSQDRGCDPHPPTPRSRTEEESPCPDASSLPPPQTLTLTVGTQCLSPTAEASSTKTYPLTGLASCWGWGWRAMGGSAGSWGEVLAGRDLAPSFLPGT